MEVPETLQGAFANFPRIFKKNIFRRDDIFPFVIENAKKEGLLLQSRRMLVSTHLLEN